MLQKRIESIEFGVLNPEQIRRMSALEIKTPDTYDKDGYPMEGGLMDPHLGVINPGLRCKTCGQRMKECPGHFGNLELVRPVVHGSFGKKLEELMQGTCQNCGKIVLKEEIVQEFVPHIGKNTDLLVKRLLAKAKKAKRCPHCGFEKKLLLLDKPTNFYLDKDRIYPTQIREWVEKIPERDLSLFGYDPNRVRPSWFILTTLQIPPITIRPSITLETGIKSEDDLTHKLVDILRINLRLKDNIEAGAPQLIIEDLWDLLQYHVTTYFDNNTAGVPPAKHRSGRALKTLVQRLKGKKGRFRYNLTGKRVNFAARSTITPDPYISITEVGVPEAIAQNLTVPEFVTEWNKESIKKIVKDGKALYLVRPNGTRKMIAKENMEEILLELDVGFKIERYLADGDMVLFNRQPSLHRLSMMAHKAKILPGKTLRINPAVCKPYNADFDGDEMNLHAPQSEEGKAEARELLFVQNHIMSPRHGGAVIILDEDGVSGTYVLTLHGTSFSRDETMKYFYEMGLTELPKPDVDGKRYSGKLIFSQLLPKDLNIEYRTKTGRLLKKLAHLPEELKEKTHKDSKVVIRNGQLLEGVIDEESLGEVTGKLVDVLARRYPPEVIVKFYDLLGRISCDVITRRGMTIGLDEYDTSDAVKRLRKRVIEEEMEEGKKLVELYRKGGLELVPGRNLDESFEVKMMQLGARIKDRVEVQIVGEKITEIYGAKPRLGTMVMILSGSRGSVTNLTNILGLWGQANVREGRPKRGYTNRLITLNEKNDVGVIAGGFIQHNFMEGLEPKEYFYHAMGGRQGEVDTGVSTKVSGYLYRRLANSLKDLVVNYDGTVRTSNKNIIQYVYGEDGVFPQKSIMGKSVDVKGAIAKREE